ncbi:MAG: hypothetical protein JWM74_3401 [Myxococcaceae bacterium]|nr:hypothetical protein [Myxococcaceae bacterium]
MGFAAPRVFKPQAVTLVAVVLAGCSALASLDEHRLGVVDGGGSDGDALLDAALDSADAEGDADKDAEAADGNVSDGPLPDRFIPDGGPVADSAVDAGPLCTDKVKISFAGVQIDGGGLPPNVSFYGAGSGTTTTIDGDAGVDASPAMHVYSPAGITGYGGIVIDLPALYDGGASTGRLRCDLDVRFKLLGPFTTYALADMLGDFVSIAHQAGTSFVSRGSQGLGTSIGSLTENTWVHVQLEFTPKDGAGNVTVTGSQPGGAASKTLPSPPVNVHFGVDTASSNSSPSEAFFDNVRCCTLPP